MTPQQQFGAAVRLRRRELRLSQHDLGRLLDLQPSVSRLERGGRDARLDTMVRIARALRTTPAELVRQIGALAT